MPVAGMNQSPGGPSLATMYGTWSWGTGNFGNNLPRPWIDFLSGAFGPLAPIQPIGVDTPTPESGRPDPRRMQYPIAWNMPIGQPGSEGLKLVSFANLRAYADLYSVVRAAIQVRKEEILGLDWDIVPTTTAQRAQRQNPSAHDDFQDRRQKVLNFFKRPDPNYHDFQGWLGAVLEDIFVVDALSLYIHPTRMPGKGLLGSTLGALEVLDGTTIRPMLDVRGGIPRPPAPAYQQYLWGVPRSDLMDIILQSDVQEMDDPVAKYRADQLLYLPYTRRSWTPYGFPGIERAILPVMTGLRKQQFQLEFFSEGSIPGQFIVPGTDISTPQQIRQLQDTLNALSGDTAWKHKMIVLPRGSKNSPQKPIELATQFDEIVMMSVCMAYEVQPMELGISPRVSTTQSPGAANQMAKASAEINTRKALKPMLQWLKTAIFDHILQTVCEQDDMQWTWVGMEQGEDAEAQMVNFKTAIGVGLMSIDEARVQLGLSPWGLPLTSDPIYMSATGVSTLGTIAPAIADAALGAPEIDPTSLATQPTSINPAAPALAAGTPGIGGRPQGGGGGAPAIVQPAAGTSTPLHGTGTRAAQQKAAADELQALRRWLKKGRKVEDWNPEFITPTVLGAVQRAVADGADTNEAVARARRIMKSTARISRREGVMQAAATSTAAALGHLAGRLTTPQVGPIQFVDRGTGVLQDAYTQVYQAGAQDAAQDYSNVSTVVPGGFGQLAAQRAARQRGFLTGMAQDVLGGASAAQVVQRLNLYARSLQPAYEQGYGMAVLTGQALPPTPTTGLTPGTTTPTAPVTGGAGGSDHHLITDLLTAGAVGAALLAAAGGAPPTGAAPTAAAVSTGGGYPTPPRSVITWRCSGDDPCDLCAPRTGVEYTLTTLPGWPGDGGFGTLCQGAANCRCYLEYSTGPTTTATATNPLRTFTVTFYAQRAAEEAQHDADAVAARQADITHVAQENPTAAARMQQRDMLYGVPGTRTGPGGRYDINAVARAELRKYSTTQPRDPTGRFAGGGGGGWRQEAPTPSPNVLGITGSHHLTVTTPTHWYGATVNEHATGRPSLVISHQSMRTGQPASKIQTLSARVVPDVTTGKQLAEQKITEHQAKTAVLKGGVKAAGIVIKADDTGRVLMVQRAIDNHNTRAAGRWEWPGGKLDAGETPLEAAQRETEQEIGVPLPKGKVVGSWTTQAGNYQAFVYVIKSETTLELNDARGLDGSGDSEVENVAWWDPALLPGNPAVRVEVQAADWALIGSAKKIKKTLPADLAAKAEVGDRIVDDATGKTYLIEALDGTEVTLKVL